MRTATLGQYMQLKVVKQDLTPTSRCLRPGASRPVRCPAS
jgi:hypothetical protein